MLTRTLESSNSAKHFLKCHLIFVCKYRKKLLKNSTIDNFIKSTLEDISSISDFSIESMESDVDHIHLLIRYCPKLSISSIVNRLKSISTNRIWKKYEEYLAKEFWKEKTFWTDGYFVSSIGMVSQETLNKYINNQG